MNPLPYPLNLLTSKTSVHPLFGDQLKGAPHVYNFSSSNPTTLEYDTKDVERFQKLIFDELESSGKTWGVGRYLEERKNVLRNYPQIVDEGRIYHLGLDIVVPPGLTLYAPLDCEVYRFDIEKGFGNYGGYAILKHNIQNTPFYSFYGHLKTDGDVVSEKQTLKAGEPFAVIGEAGKDSGYWFTHTHLQILTQKAVDEGRLLTGYISAANMPTLESYFPSPYLLFRY